MVRIETIVLGILILSVNTEATDVIFGALLGRDSSIKPAYSLTSGRSLMLKEVIDDAAKAVSSNYSFLTSSHQLKAEFREENKDSLYHAMKLICDTIQNMRPTFLIITEDACPDCSDIASYASKGTEGPIISIGPGAAGVSSRAFKMYPTPDDMNSFYQDMIEYYKWKQFTVIYDHGEMFVNFLPIRMWADSKKFNVTFESFEGDMDRLAQRIYSRGDVNIFLFTITAEASLDIIVGAIDRGLLSRKYHWIIGHLDVVIQRPISERIENEGAFMTRFIMNYTTEWQYTIPSFHDQQAILHEWPLQYRLAFDAVLAGGYGLLKYRDDQPNVDPLNVYTAETIIQPCEESTHNRKPRVKKIYNDTRFYTFEGLSGNIAFNENGDRVNYSLMVYNGRGRALNQLLGEWVQNPKHWEDRYKVKWESNGRFNTTRYEMGGKRKLKVVSIEVPPFLMLKNDPKYNSKRDTTDYKDYDRFQGFIVDLLEEIKTNAKGIDFDYDIELVPDGKYGKRGKFNKIWNGMVGEVYRGKADIAAGPLTIRPDRERDIQFTSAFMQADLAALVHHPSYRTGDLLSFFYPFSLWVWLLNGVVFLLVSAIIYAINYFDPYEWGPAALRGDAYQENMDNFNLTNTMWFLSSTLFLQSFDSSPRSNAGRTMAVFWWVFVIIMVFLYIMNFPYFILPSKRLTSIRSMDEMLDKHDVKPGIVKGDSTFFLLKSSKDQTLNRFFKYIEYAEPSVIVPSIEDGIARVRDKNSRFVLVGESPVLAFHASKEPCDLHVTNGKIFRQSYALAVRKNSPLIEPLSHAIDLLIKSEQIHRLELNWWQRRYNRCGNMTTWEKQGIYSFTSVDLYGIYILFMIGTCFSVIVFLIEFCFCDETKNHKKKIKKMDDNSGRQTNENAAGDVKEEKKENGCYVVGQSEGRPPKSASDEKKDWL